MSSSSSLRAPPSGSRSVSQAFQQFQVSRTQFAQAIAEFAGRPECVEQLLQENIIGILPTLLTDTNPTIQQNAALAVGRLASHSAQIADLMVKADLLPKLVSLEQDKPNRYLKRAILISLKQIVKQSPEMVKPVIDSGGLDFAITALEEFDTAVKESAAAVLGFMARHNIALATEVIGAGGIPLLVLALQEPEVTVRVVAASALSDIAKHAPETAQAVVDAGTVIHLVRASGNPDGRLRRTALFCLASIAKHNLRMAEIVIEADTFPLVLEHAGHPDELVRKAATSLIKEIIKHSACLAKLVVEGGGLGVLVNTIVRNKGENRLAAVLALGYIAGHNAALAFSVIYSKGVDALALVLDEEQNNVVGASAAWALGHIGRHSDEHAKHITSVGLLPKILQVYNSRQASEEMKLKAKQALKMILLRTDDLDAVEPLLSSSPPEIFKYIVAQYSKILPKDPAARRNFVTSGGLRKIQELLTPDCPDVLREHIIMINSCYPPDVVNYFSPDYPQTLLERIDQYTPALNIDPSMWTEKLFSDTRIPGDVKEELSNLQRAISAANKQDRERGEKRQSSLQQHPLPSISSKERASIPTEQRRKSLVAKGTLSNGEGLGEYEPRKSVNMGGDGKQ